MVLVVLSASLDTHCESSLAMKTHRCEWFFHQENKNVPVGKKSPSRGSPQTWMESDTNIHREMVSAVDVASYQENEFWVVWKSGSSIPPSHGLQHFRTLQLGGQYFRTERNVWESCRLDSQTEIPDISKNPDNSYIRDIFSAMIRGRTSNNCGMNSLQYSRNLHVLK